MYLTPPHTKSGMDLIINEEKEKQAKADHDLNKFVNLKKLREHDLLLLSENKLNL